MLSLEEKVAKILLDINAVSVSPSAPFRYASGIMSPIYIDCRVLNSHPDEREFVFDSMVNYISDNIKKENIDVIAGTGSQGISFATYLSSKLNIPMIYVRNASKKHGRKNQIEGVLEENKKVLLINDIISTEAIIPETIKVLKGKNAKIIGCLSVFNMGLDFVDLILKNENIKLHSLTNLNILLKIALSKKKINLYEHNIVREWAANPKEWDEKKGIIIEKISSEHMREVAEILLKIKSVSISPKKPFVYSSGIISPIYCDNRLLMSYPNEWNKIIEMFLNLIVYKIGTENIDAIGGIDSAGISHASNIAQRLHLPMIYIKSERVFHGKFKKIEGELKKNSRVLVIEDLISTGKSSVEAVELLRDIGADVRDCLAIFTYDLKKARENFERIRCNLTCLTDFSTLIDFAAENKILSTSEVNSVMEWNRAPENWKPDAK